MRSFPTVVLFALLLIFPTIPRRSEAAITSILEEPGNTQVVSGIRNVRGWAFSGSGSIEHVEMFIDGVSNTTIPCCSARGDVKAAIPTAPDETGFSAVWNWGLVSNGQHDVIVRITDSLGTSVDRAVTITVQNLQDPAVGAFLQNEDLTSATCIRSGNGFCCNNVQVSGKTNHQVCNNVCYKWDVASQVPVLVSRACGEPVAIP
jgi:hypothetical protein